jgi:arylsulfatase A-like enzyme
MRSLGIIVALLVVALLVQSGDAGVPVFAAGILPAAGGLGLPFLTAAQDYECLGCSVILISIDTLRPDHLGCYGSARDTSPNIDRLAADSVVFRNAIAQAPSTVRSHASILTSLFNFQHQARFLPMSPLPDAAVTVTEVLSRQGYQTAAFTGSGQTHPEYGLSQGFDLYDHRDRRKFHEAVDDAIDWLEKEPRGKFFLFLHTYEVHAPYTPSKEYLDLLEPEPASGLPDQISLDLLDEINQEFFGRRTYSPADLRQITRSYDAEIRSVDDGLGRLVEYLKSRGEYDDILIVFTGDHGEEFGEHGEVGRHSYALYDVILRVPLLIKFPREAFASASVRSQVRSIDIAPTITDVLAIEPPPSFQGVSLVDVAAGRNRDTLVAISERGDRDVSIAIRTERWKLYDGRLFDLVADPGEEHDVSDRYPTVRDTMEKLLVETLSTGNVLEAEEATPSDEILRELRALGYVQ